MLDSIFQELKTFVNKRDDDLIDRYNHRYTVMFISFFIFIIASKQYFGEPIVWLILFYFNFLKFSKFFVSNFFFKAGLQQHLQV